MMRNKSERSMNEKIPCSLRITIRRVQPEQDVEQKRAEHE
jgi:hypothetical protein